MTEPEVTNDSSLYEARRVRYMWYRWACNGLFVALTWAPYILLPSWNVSGKLSDLLNSTLLHIIGTVAVSLTAVIALDTVVFGGICGWLVFGSAREGMIPSWKYHMEMHKHVR